MKKHVVRTLLAGTTAGTALTLAATAALATTLTVTVTGASSNGAVSASSGKTELKDTRTGDVLTCTTSSWSGTVKNQTTSGSPPVKVGTISAGFKSCTGPGGLPLTVTLSGSLVLTRATSSGVTAGGLTSARLTLSGTACMFTATGSLPGTFTNPSGTTKPVLALSPSATNPDKFALKIASARCLGIYKAGDTLQFTASYTVTKPATLTVNAH
jgi:hypothetical protein